MLKILARYFYCSVFLLSLAVTPTPILAWETSNNSIGMEGMDSSMDSSQHSYPSHPTTTSHTSNSYFDTDSSTPCPQPQMSPQMSRNASGGVYGTVSDVSSGYSGGGGNGICCPKGPIGLILDKDFSPLVGSSGLISILRTYMSIDDHVYPNSTGDTNAHMILGRAAKAFLEDIVFSTGMVTQHEIFGHGWRAREFNIPVYKYRIRPYKGETDISIAHFNQLNPSKRIALIAGGVESTSLLAKQLRNRWLETRSLDEREGHFYLNNILDQTLYVWRTRHGYFRGHNDISSYILQVNNWYGRPVLNHRKLAQNEMIDLLDPYMWFSLYGLGTYLYDGSQCFEYPMIPLGDYQYLPGFRVALAPYGPEYQFINYIRALDYTIQATVRYGSTGGKHSEALVLEMTRLWVADCLSFDGRVDLWSQPRLFIATAHQADRKFGGALSLTARYKIVNNFELMGQAGYKTSGYMPGEPLKRGMLFRAGFFVHI